MAAPGRQACIVGIGETEYTRWGRIGRSELALACEAILKAAADAGLDPKLIDGVSSYAYDENDPTLLEQALGLPLRHIGMVWGGGGGGSYAAIAQAAAAVEAGHADYVAVFRSLCQKPGQRYGQAYPVPHGENFLTPFGMYSPPIMLAPLYNRYRNLYGITDEQVGEVALSFRRNAQRNPRAVMRDRPLTMDDYLASRKITEPFRLFDCCLETDGACALIVTTEERARDLKGKAVRILAAGHGNDPGFGPGGLGYHNMPDDDYHSGNGKWLAKRLFAEAGLTPDDIDTIQIYDHYSYTALVMLEVYGFCGRGEGGAYVADGNIRWPDGKLPANTSGGLLSEAYIHGLNLAVEGVRQMRGEATSQVADARTCLVTIGVSAVILGA